ncbi:MAG: right-handed parallel beta-helix repeat-containing protein [Elusimicrobia bacterium]|nr:right-handed parallel beta-helix repeat-containing protein [Elusimicrobiota bacterium]
MRAWIWAVLLFLSSLARADLIVDGVGPDDDNGVAGIQRADPPHGILRPDSCLVTRHFRTLQSALYTLETGLLRDRKIVITTNVPLLANDPGVPLSVSPNIVVRVPVEIVSGPGVHPVIQRGRTGIYIEVAAPVIIRGIEIASNTLDGIYGSGPGLTSGPSVTLEDVVVHSNGQAGAHVRDRSSLTALRVQAYGNGRQGLVAADHSDLKVTDSDVSGNSSSGVFLKNSGVAMILRNKIRGNVLAGVSLQNGGTGVVKNNDISGNREGGIGIEACPGSVEVRENKIHDNSSLSSGGGIVAWAHSNPTIVANTISGNTAEPSGGGVALIDSGGTVGGTNPGDANTIVSNKTTDGVGGGVACANTTPSMKIIGNTIQDNEALGGNIALGGKGGGVGAATDCRGIISKNRITNNRARFIGGGISVKSDVQIGGTTSVDKNFVQANKVVAGSGGGIGCFNGSPKILNNDINANTASPGSGTGGGGVSLVGSCKATLKSNKIGGNRAERGGGILIDGAGPVVGDSGEGNTITANTATEQVTLPTLSMGHGAGIYLNNAVNATLTGNTIVANIGSGIHVDGGDHNTFTENHIGEMAGASMRNIGHGIALIQTHDNTVGPGNSIANNSGSGVSVGNMSFANRITKNSITGNRESGIDLWTGGNMMQARPILLEAYNASIKGSAGAPAGSTVEIFTDSNGQGQRFITSTPLAPDQTFTLPGSAFGSVNEITLTVTDSAGNTSRFGQGRLDAQDDSLNTKADGPPDGNDAEEAAQTTNPGKVIKRARVPPRRQEMAAIVLKQLPRSLSKDGTLTLSVSDQEIVRILDQNGVARIGPAGGPGAGAFYDIPWPGINAGDLTFRAVGIKEGPVTISLSYKDNGVVSGHDDLLINVSTVQFYQSTICAGFDDSREPNALMVPAGGTNSANATRIIPSGAATAIRFTSADDSVGTVTPAVAPGSPVNVVVAGVSSGFTAIRARASPQGPTIRRMWVDVKDRLHVEVAIHAITNTSAVPPQVPVNAPTAAALETYLNDEIWGPQANVYFTVTRSDRGVPYDLDGDGGLKFDGLGYTDEEDAIRAAAGEYRGFGTINIYYVNNLLPDPLSPFAPPAEEGETLGRDIFIQDGHVGSAKMVTAHEVGHALGQLTHSTDPKDVMYFQDLGMNPCNVKKRDWDVVNR